MRTTRMSVWTALALTACGVPGEPTLTLSSDVSSFDGRTEHAVLKVHAQAPSGAPGAGVVTLVAAAGRFVEGTQITLADGLGTATYVCDPSEDAACSGLMPLGASWSGLSTSTKVRVTPSTTAAGVKWKVAPTYTLSRLTAMAVGPAGKLWAVGTSGAVVSLEGSTWSTVPSSTTNDLLAVAFAPSGEGIAVGRQGTLLVEGAGGLAPVATGLEADLTAVWATAKGDAVVGASDGTLYHFDGAALTATGNLGTAVRSLTATTTGLWAAGDGALKGWVSGSWSATTLPLDARVAVAVPSPEGLWLGGARSGASGVLLLGPTDWRTFELTEAVTALAVVPESAERFVVTKGSVLRQLAVGGPFSAVESPMGGDAAASRAAGDLVIVGAPGLSLLRE